jgi:hypothetical protein
MSEPDSMDLQIEKQDDINVPVDGKPPPVHVPPRIDPDLYQADVPDWSPDIKCIINFSIFCFVS